MEEDYRAYLTNEWGVIKQSLTTIRKFNTTLYLCIPVHILKELIKILGMKPFEDFIKEINQKYIIQALLTKDAKTGEVTLIFTFVEREEATLNIAGYDIKIVEQKKTLK